MNLILMPSADYSSVTTSLKLRKTRTGNESMHSQTKYGNDTDNRHVHSMLLANWFNWAFSSGINLYHIYDIKEATSGVTLISLILKGRRMD